MSDKNGKNRQDYRRPVQTSASRSGAGAASLTQWKTIFGKIRVIFRIDKTSIIVLAKINLPIPSKSCLEP